MALKTALVIDGNSEAGKKALAELDGAIDRSEKQARQLAAAFSAADIATTRLASAQTAAKAQTAASTAAFKAGEIGLEEYERQLIETKTALGLVQAGHRETVAALRQAQVAYDGAAGRGQQFTRSLGEQRIGAQQLAMNLGDMTTMFALGARPMQIFASQSGQIVQSISLMAGGAGSFAKFMMSGWGTALTAGAIVLVPLIGYLLDTKDAMEEVEFASDKLGDVQGILGRVMDLTTGKITTQKDALLELARAQIALGQAEATRDMAQARRQLGNLDRDKLVVRGGGLPVAGGLSIANGRGPEGDIAAAFLGGSLSGREARRGLESMRDTGMIDNDTFLKALAPIVNYGVAQVNQGEYDDAKALLDGTGGRNLLKPDKDKPKKPTGPSAAEIAQQHAAEMRQLQQEELHAQLDLTTDARDRADLQQQLLRAEFDDRVAQIENNKNFTAEQKRAQVQALDRLYGVVRNADGSMTLGSPGLLQQGVNRERDRALEQEAQQLADARNQVAQQALQAQIGLADTEAGRKSLALQIFDAEEAYLRSKLEAVIASETAAQAEKDQARLLLEGLKNTAADRREGVARANATAIERYVRELHQAPEQISEAIGKIEVEGLDALNAGIVDAIMGAKSLGDVFHDVAGQIIADLLRIAVQRSIVSPLADMLFGSAGGGPENLLPGGGGGGIFSAIGKLFGGGRAAGGPVSPGQFYAVNEMSTAPGLFFPISPGRIEPPGGGGAGGREPTVIQLVVTRGEMFEAHVERVSGEAAVQVVSHYAPAIVEGAVAETTRQFTRMGMG